MAEQNDKMQSNKKGNKRFQLCLGLVAFVLASLLYTATAQAAQVKNIKLAPSSTQTRILIDLNQNAGHRIFLLADPKRVVIDLPKSKINQRVEMPKGSGVVTRIRHGAQDSRLRLVADLKADVFVSSHVLAVKNNHKARRLVIELDHKAVAQSILEPVRIQATKVRDLIVAIDAGHGGRDPGSIGPHGTREKEVVLQIAIKLAAKINKEKGMSAYLVRQNDRKIPYRERIKRARSKNADLFISVHADSFRDASVTGSSVYVLSQRGASSSTARWLANKVNSADLIGGVSLDDKDDTLASVLLDLSQNASIAASTRLGKSMLKELAAIGRIRKQSVQYANFAVLKSPDVPSILVETGYISNPDEERKLKNTKHQEKIAKALFAGVKSYFTHNPPSQSIFAKKKNTAIPKIYVAQVNQTQKSSRGEQVQKVKTATANVQSVKKPSTIRVAKREVRVRKKSRSKGKTEYQLKPHKVKSGESLSAVSRRYNVTIQALKRINNLKNDSVWIGQILQVPISIT